MTQETQEAELQDSALTLTDDTEEVAQRKDEIRKLIAKCFTRSEITSWKRKDKNLGTLLDTEIQPLHDQIQELQIKLIELIDKSNAIRDEMVTTCIHPPEYVEVNLEEKFSTCKFCNRNLKLSN